MSDSKTSDQANKGGVVSRLGVYSKIAAHADELLARLIDLSNSRNENVAVAASKILFNKIVPDLSSVELGGQLDENGERQPLRLLINAGNGFLPATITVSTPPTRSPAEPSTEIQSVSLAPQGAQDLHGDHGNSQTSPS